MEDDGKLPKYGYVHPMGGQGCGGRGPVTAFDPFWGKESPHCGPLNLRVVPWRV